MWWCYCACLALALGGFLLLPAEQAHLRRYGLIALLVIVIQATFLTLIRAKTTLWMLPSALPPVALIIAIGWYGWLAANTAMLRRIGIALLIVYIAMILAPFNFFLHHIHTLRVPSHINLYTDIGQWDDDYKEGPVSFIPVRQLDRIGASICGPSVLHARLASAIEQSLATPVTVACGANQSMRFGGKDGDGRHLAGFSVAASLATKIEPERVVAGMAMYDNVRAIAPDSGGWPTNLPRMQITPNTPSILPTHQVYSFDTRAADVVVLTNRFPMAAGMNEVKISANAQQANQIYDDGGSLLYACTGCTAEMPAHWHVELDGIGANLDLIVIQEKSAAH